MKLFVALGPGDIVGAVRSRLEERQIPETSIAFSEQLFDYCKMVEMETLAISSHSRSDQILDKIITVENRPKLFQGRGGILFHLSALHYAFYLAFRARRFGADLALIDSGTTHYFLLMAFHFLGMRVAVNLHNVLWPVGFPPKSNTQIAIRSLNAWFFRNFASGAMGVSPECERQILAESQNKIPFFQYRSQFSTKGFLHSAPYEGGSFHIACVGRIEENKGFLDIADIAQSLRSKSSVAIIFHVCGDGPALPSLRRLVEANHLSSNVILHGRLERDSLLAVYAKSHAVLVPTKSTFGEGMPQVCAEAVLAGLPVVTSPVSNAFDVIGSVIVKAETDNISSYVNAILKLVNDPALYRSLRSHCSQCSQQFLDRSQGYSAAVSRLIHALFPASG